MRNLDAIAEEQLRIDTQLLEGLRQLGITNSQYDFSRLCGMNPSYFSTMKCKGAGLSIGRLVYLWSFMAKLSNEATDPRAGAVFKHAAGIVRSAVTRKCELQNLRRRGDALEGR